MGSVLICGALTYSWLFHAHDKVWMMLRLWEQRDSHNSVSTCCMPELLSSLITTTAAKFGGSSNQKSHASCQSCMQGNMAPLASSPWCCYSTSNNASAKAPLIQHPRRAAARCHQLRAICCRHSTAHSLMAN